MPTRDMSRIPHRPDAPNGFRISQGAANPQVGASIHPPLSYNASGPRGSGSAGPQRRPPGGGAAGASGGTLAVAYGHYAN